MRKTAIILICAILLGTFVNRNAFKDDISNRSVVQGVGIDLNDDGTYTVVIETINTDNYSNADGSASPVTNLQTLSGTTVNTAIKSAYAKTGKTPVMSQNRVIVIGKNLAESGIIPALDFFIRDAESHPTVLVAAAAGRADDFFRNASDDTNVVSRDLENIILTAEDDITVSSITLCELVNRLESVGNAFYMPLVAAKKNGGKGEVVSKGTAIFSVGKYICSLGEEETAGLNFLCDNVKSGSTDFSFDGTPAAISIIKSNTKRKITHSSDDGFTFHINVKIEADLAEIGSNSVKKLNNTDPDELCKFAQEKIKRNIEALCTKLYEGTNIDAPGFGRLIYIYYPSFYRENEENLNEIMAQCRFSVEVDVNIRRIGQDNSV